MSKCIRDYAGQANLGFIFVCALLWAFGHNSVTIEAETPILFDVYYTNIIIARNVQLSCQVNMMHNCKRTIVFYVIIYIYVILYGCNNGTLFTLINASRYYY